jgi:hypothetical protein
MTGVGDASHDDLRRLAGWLARRREVDEAVEALTAYGPAASERVAASLVALTGLLDAEREAFRRYAAAAPLLPQRPLPTTVEAPEEGLAAVRSLDLARLQRR